MIHTLFLMNCYSKVPITYFHIILKKIKLKGNFQSSGQVKYEKK